MYLDLVVVLIIIVLGLIKYKNASSYVYLFCASDMAFRILSFLKNNINMGSINSFINKYIPSSIYDVIVKYTGGTIEQLLIWVYVIVFAVFLYYTIKSLLNRR